MKADEKIYVRPRAGEYEVVKPGHRRGPSFAGQELAIEHATGLAAVVVVLNRTGKVEQEVRVEEDLDALVAEYYAVLAGEGNDADGHWSIAERWSYGKHLGWFVEHDGLGLDGGEDGPYATLEEAQSKMAAHLRAAIAGARRS